MSITRVKASSECIVYLYVGVLHWDMGLAILNGYENSKMWIMWDSVQIPTVNLTCQAAIIVPWRNLSIYNTATAYWFKEFCFLDVEGCMQESTLFSCF